MAKKRIYVPVDEIQLSNIKKIAKLMDRSEAYIASLLIRDGLMFNILENFTISRTAKPEDKFKERH